MERSEERKVGTQGNDRWTSSGQNKLLPSSLTCGRGRQLRADRRLAHIGHFPGREGRQSRLPLTRRSWAPSELFSDCRGGPVFPCLAEDVFQERDFSSKGQELTCAALGLLGGAFAQLAGMVTGLGWTLVALTLVHAEPVSAQFVGLGAVWSHPRLLGLRLPGAGRFGLSLLQPLRRPMLAIGAVRLTLPIVAPSIWRSIRYWRRIVPIFARYLWAKHRAVRLRRQGRHDEADMVWEKRHIAGAEEIFQMLVDLKGFYLKLGQIIATKTDMLGPVYTRSLGRLHDQMPFESVDHVRKVLTKELKQPSEEVFEWIDALPLASATIAQVHRARLSNGEPVVVKVQHQGVERMMRSDLRNMRMFSEVLELSPLDLGFDMLSLIREYQAIVPFEFDFTREGTMQTLVKQHLMETGYGPFLVVPRVLPWLTSKQILVMEYLDGVPILDVKLMEELDKIEFMTKLIRSFGIMILRDGVFHTDPHPGNLLALHNHRTGQTAVGLLDFGQVKELTMEAQENYAKLVIAMADRNPVQVRAVMQSVGLDIRGCSEEFQALAGYILFDTRMDFEEAWMSPFDEAAHEFRNTIVKVFPQELFMIMRVITLFRGILGSLEIDVSSALLWRDLAEDVLLGRSGLRAQLATSNSIASPAEHAASSASKDMVSEPISPNTDQEEASYSINVSAVRELTEMHAKRQLDSGDPATQRGPVKKPETQSSLENMRELLLASRSARPPTGGPIFDRTMEEMMRQMPNLRAIHTAPPNVDDIAGKVESPREEGALNLRLRPFETIDRHPDDNTDSLKAGAQAREALRTHDGSGFTFSPHASDRDLAVDTQTWSMIPSARDDLAISGNSAENAVLGVSGSSSARLAGQPSSKPSTGSTTMEKPMHMRAGAPQMNYKVKLSDV